MSNIIGSDCWWQDYLTQEWQRGTLVAFGTDSETDGDVVLPFPAAIVLDHLSSRLKSVSVTRVSMASVLDKPDEPFLPEKKQ